jgi:hypothetical protein
MDDARIPINPIYAGKEDKEIRRVKEKELSIQEVEQKKEKNRYSNNRDGKDIYIYIYIPSAAARVRVRPACGVCGGQSGTGAGFLRVLRFPLPIIPQISPLS